MLRLGLDKLLDAVNVFDAGPVAILRKNAF